MKNSLANTRALQLAARCFVFLAIITTFKPLLQGQNIDLELWEKELKRYVNNQGLVDYANWKKRTANLDRIMSQFAEAHPPASDADEKCLWINAYNAAAILLILEHYPLESIQDINGTFTEKRFQVQHTRVSLDDVENRLRSKGDPRIHAALVCAATGSPMLRREAYVSEKLDSQLDEQVRTWLATDRLNRYQPQLNRVEISSIFKWYEPDFEKNGRTVRLFLKQYAPGNYAELLSRPDYEIAYMPFNWSLNDQADSSRFLLLSKLWSTVKSWI